MRLYIGQEVLVWCPASHKVVITELITHKNTTTVRSRDVVDNSIDILFFADDVVGNQISRGYFGFILNNLEDYLPSLIFHKLEESEFITINLGLIYGDKYILTRLIDNILIEVINTKEDYMRKYGGVLKLLHLYETYEKRIDHIIKTLVLLLHFDLTNKEKICT